jgi:hypothetical protein
MGAGTSGSGSMSAPADKGPGAQEPATRPLGGGSSK